MFRIVVSGVVQGVGFRPFVYRLAKEMKLRGYVKNCGDGTVEIVIDREVEKFVERLKKEIPDRAKIESVKVEKFEGFFDDFKIVESGGKTGILSLPPPDIAVCEDCLREVFDEKDRRYLYPFTTCTSCGQRFAISERLPFDRENTTLAEFPLCEDCKKEYENPEDRRFYAQSIACPSCGPNYKLLPKGIFGVEAIKEAAKMIDSGYFVAIKGIGGIHLSCLTEDEIVWKLRKILHRPQQPFAVMVRDVEAAKNLADINEEEIEELKSFRRPILVCKKRVELEAVAPNLDTVGIMLPYTPLHYILFKFLRAEAVVMTSANFPGEPMATNLEELKVPYDAFLNHNMRIANRVDDSVVKFINGRRMIIRRSRGFVPEPIEVDIKSEAVAVGAELYNSLCFLKEGKAVMSQYIGNTANFKTFNDFFKKALNHFTNYLDLKPEFIVADMHPLYNTSLFAEKFGEEVGAEVLKVQHHFAHALSVMAEKKLDEAVAIAVDGVGYGMDGKIWGGEVLYINLSSGEFERVGRLETINLLGGDLAVERPLRVLFSIIYSQTGSWEDLRHYEKYLKRGESFEIFEEQLKKGIGVVEASSTGRILDAASAMLEICFERTYEGEPAMKLEAVAKESERYYDPIIETSWETSKFSSPFDGKGRRGEVKVLKIGEVFEDALKRYLNGERREKIAYQIISYLARGLSEIASEFKAPLVISGGVAYNSIFQKEIGREFYTNELVACGDNGISLGQIYALKVIE
ncbi:carbamoyltransferase HypF [Ferroglobus sp.]|uniref:carbamoyltransferase HypF n=1 Tax=Ferroglobus sp. TaxID=2614230 RepID=UPI0025BBFE84|nr:carbamoyltransferase HypF [Ferroglobus sp.]